MKDIDTYRHNDIRIGNTGQGTYTKENRDRDRLQRYGHKDIGKEQQSRNVGENMRKRMRLKDLGKRVRRCRNSNIWVWYTERAIYKGGSVKD
jgi:hypothetical protein